MPIVHHESQMILCFGLVGHLISFSLSVSHDSDKHIEKMKHDHKCWSNKQEVQKVSFLWLLAIEKHLVVCVTKTNIVNIPPWTHKIFIGKCCHLAWSKSWKLKLALTDQIEAGAEYFKMNDKNHHEIEDIDKHSPNCVYQWSYSINKTYEVCYFHIQKYTSNRF